MSLPDRTAPVEDSEPIAKSGWFPAPTKNGKKGKSAPVKNSKRNARAGGRWKLLAVRYTVWGVMGLVFLLGIMRIVNPNPVSLSAITDSVKTAIGQNGFPMDAGQQMASRFAAAYLNYDANLKTQRQDILEGYLAPGASGDFTYSQSDNPTYTQKVTDGPYLATNPYLVDASHVTFTFSVQVSNAETGKKDADGNLRPPTWVYLTVPMVADKLGNVAVAGAPAFVSAPPLADKVDSIAGKVDEKATASAKPFIKQYLTDWAKSSQATPVQDNLVRKASTQAARIGLGGTVTLKNDPEVVVLVSAPTDVYQKADVTVTWVTSTGMSMTQDYELTLEYADSHWYAIDIVGANFY